MKLIYRNQKYVFLFSSLIESVKSFGSGGFKYGRSGNRKQTQFFFGLIIKRILQYRNGPILLKVKVTRTKIGAFLTVQYLWIFAMIVFLTSYSKDKREKEVKYWSVCQKVKGQPSCHFLVALYFWQNIFTPFNHRYIQLCIHMNDDYWKTLKTSKDKKAIDQGQYRMLSDRALCLCHFFGISASISAPYTQFAIKVRWTFYGLEYSLCIAWIILHAL